MSTFGPTNWQWHWTSALNLWHWLCLWLGTSAENTHLNEESLGVCLCGLNISDVISVVCDKAVAGAAVCYMPMAETWQCRG